MKGIQDWKDERIRAALADGWSYSEIQKRYSVSPTRISRIVSGKSIPHARGRPRRMTPEIRDYVETNTLLNARISNSQMANMVRMQFGQGFDPSTIAKLRRELHFHYRKSLRIQQLTEEQKFQRFQFAKDMLKILDDPMYRDLPIIFSDESRFCLQADGFFCYVRRGQWNQTACHETKKFSNGVMYWGAIAEGYRSPLMRCSGGVNQQEYLRILKESGMFERMDEVKGKFGWMFMQDGAPCHTANVTMGELVATCLLVPGWPPNSPDLNPIEMLWGVIKHGLQKAGLTDESQLGPCVERAWNEIAMETIESLVNRFRTRLEMVVKIQGESISQLLSSHMEDPKPGMVVDHDWTLFTEEEDAALTRFHEQFGNQWKKITGLSKGHRNRNEIKQRIQFLQQSKRNKKNRTEAMSADRISSDQMTRVPNSEFARILEGFLQRTLDAHERW